MTSSEGHKEATEVQRDVRFQTIKRPDCDYCINILIFIYLFALFYSVGTILSLMHTTQEEMWLQYKGCVGVQIQFSCIHAAKFECDKNGNKKKSIT